ncbi:MULTISPECIES: SGNH/GDSL hydrolase family protein [unclassified Microcella]|uniref:SGNH/GDSL hydrolase family protein n=1 Tax=unclassified Microcella TaxID=2630066 RepID=UPI0006F51FB3|nr:MULTISPECIES: SGNH/GDSL hydrolase family protein [unclassified Microcella]KQV25645.1 G-D-S-L family lipolytic protein [Yonghaparkia sp. Root332]KRF33546.1 G-D-S-L family lipolytic protein [Yonghaparkia sp. Soil809]
MPTTPAAGARRALLAALAAIATSALVGCAAGPSGAPASPDSDGDGPLVAFYGDSYTLGTGASDPSKRWSSIIAVDRGWREFNPSVNGLGYVRNRPFVGDGDLPSMIIEQRPDIVVVTMGLNDNFDYDRVGEGIREAMIADLDRLVAGLPEARFIVVEPFWYTDVRPESVEIISGWQREQAERIGADYIAGASRWIEGRPDWMAADGLHPNDEGYAAMAERMDAELTKLGL